MWHPVGLEGYTASMKLRTQGVEAGVDATPLLVSSPLERSYGNMVVDYTVRGSWRFHRCRLALYIVSLMYKK